MPSSGPRWISHLFRTVTFNPVQSKLGNQAPCRNKEIQESHFSNTYIFSAFLVVNKHNKHKKQIIIYAKYYLNSDAH